MKPLHGLQEPKAQVSWVLQALVLRHAMGAALVGVCTLALHASLSMFPSCSGQNCLSSARAGCGLQFQQGLQGQGLSIISPSPKG